MTNFLKNRGATLEDLRGIETPPAQGPRHRPVPHIDVVESLIRGLEERDLEVLEADYLAEGEVEDKETGKVYRGTDLYGHLTLGRKGETLDDYNTYSAYDSGPASPGGGWRRAIGFRTSNRRRHSLQVRGGAEITVCSNGWFFGGEAIANRLHTSGLIIDEAIQESLDSFMKQVDEVDLTLQRQQDYPLKDDEAQRILFGLFRREVLPLRYLRPSAENYFRPGQAMTDCQGRNLFGLQSAITRELRTLSVRELERHTVNLARALEVENIPELIGA